VTHRSSNGESGAKHVPVDGRSQPPNRQFDCRLRDFTVVESRREEHLTPGDAIQPFTWIAAKRLD
jgi:hypothetical protein